MLICKALLRKSLRILVEGVLEEDGAVVVVSTCRAEEDEPAVEELASRAEAADRAGESGGSIESSSDNAECRISKDGVQDVIERFVVLREEEQEDPGVKR